MAVDPWRDIAVAPYCWFCCCACLPMVGLLKGLLICIPCAFIPTIACFLMALVLLPHDVVLSFYTLAATPRLGCTIKFFALLLLPVPLLLWPFMVLLGVLLGAFCYALGGPVVLTFSSKEESVCVAGVAEVVKVCVVEFPKAFWDFNYNSYFAYLLDFRAPLKQDEKPFDIPIYWIPFGLLLVFLGELVSLPSALVIGIIKFFPGLFRCYLEIVKLWWDADSAIKVLSFPLWVLSLLLMPFGAVIILILFLLYSIYVGITPAIEAWNEGSLAGFATIIQNVFDMDQITNMLIFDWDESCMPCCDLESMICKSVK